jgi:hypothetical protein
MAGLQPTLDQLELFAHQMQDTPFHELLVSCYCMYRVQYTDVCIRDILKM